MERVVTTDVQPSMLKRHVSRTRPWANAAGNGHQAASHQCDSSAAWYTLPSVEHAAQNGTDGAELADGAEAVVLKGLSQTLAQESQQVRETLRCFRRPRIPDREADEVRKVHAGHGLGELP